MPFVEWRMGFLKVLFGLEEESEGDGAEQSAGDETPQPPVATNQ